MTWVKEERLYQENFIKPVMGWMVFREKKSAKEGKVKKPLEINVYENVIVSEFVGAARFYQKHFKVLLLIIVIMMTLPITGYWLGGILGAIIGGSVCNVGAFLLGRRATEELSNLVEHKKN